MSEAKLKPCPFCGSADVCVVSFGYGVRCRDCEMAFSGTAPGGAEKWNRRADPPVLECHVCGCKRVLVYELGGLPVIECTACNRSWDRHA